MIVPLEQRKQFRDMESAKTQDKEVAKPPSRSVGNATRRGRFVVIVGVGILGLTLAGLALWGVVPGPSGQEPTERVLAVTVRRLESSSGYGVRRQFVGKVEAARNSLLSFQLAGLVIDVDVEEGDSVRSGQVLARLDTDKLKARKKILQANLGRVQATLKELREGPRKEVIEATRADLSRAKAESRLAILQADRKNQLLQRRAVSERDWEKAQFTARARKAEVDLLKARLDELLNGTRQEKIDAQAAVVRKTKAEIDSLQVDLADSDLKAPYSGVVAIRYVDEGEVIEAGKPVIELVEMSDLRVRVGVSGRAAESLSVGQSQDVLVRGQSYQGKVLGIRPDRNTTTRTVIVLVGLKAPGSAIKVGDLATLRVTQDVERTGFWVPLSALTEGTRGLWTCYVASPLPDDSDTKATHEVDSRPVELLHQTEDRGYVIGPLTEDELLISEGLHRLVPQQKVVLASQGGGPE